MRTSIYTAILLLAFLNYSCGDEKKGSDSAEPEVKTVEQKFEHKAEKIEASFKDGGVILNGILASAKPGLLERMLRLTPKSRLNLAGVTIVAQ